MLPLFSKPVESIAREDVEQVLEEEFPEGSIVEYKETLPTKKGKKDSWLEGKTKISDYARNGVLAEIIAFANSHGGHLLLGIEESSDEPPKAAALNPIPRCAELAEKIRLVARDCIEPQLPIIRTRGIPTNDDAGVVIIRVPQSRLAPHRLKQTLHCYYRRNDRCEKMSMRDIQDLTLQRDQGLTAIEKKFDERGDALSHRLEKMTANPSNRHLLVVRATLLPLSTDLWVDKLFQNHAVAPLYENFHLSVRQNPERIYMPHRGSSNSRPVLGGVRHTNRVSDSRLIMRELMRNGLVEFLDIIYTNKSRHNDLSPSQFLAFVMNAVLTAHKVRSYAGVPEVEYGLEVEIIRTSGDIQISEFPSPYGSAKSFDVEYNPLRLQRLSVGPPEEFNHIMKILLRDILNAAGLEAPDDVEIIIPSNLLTV